MFYRSTHKSRSHTFISTLILAGALFSLAACGGEQIDPTTIGDPARGQDLFETGADKMTTGCAECHSLEGGDLLNLFDEPIAPTLEGIGQRAGVRVADMPAVDYIRESIENPEAYIVEGYDEKYYMSEAIPTLLNDEDVNDLIAFLITK